MYERQPWSEFLRELRWRQGEHWLTAAPTQTGKTTLTALLLERRNHAVVLASKTKDPHMESVYAKFTRSATWPPPREARKILLWPKKQKTLTDKIEHQRKIFKECMDAVGNTGGWCLVVDEFHWLSQFLRLDREDAVLQHEGSGAGTTVVNLTQRPAWIPRITYSSATHALIGRTTDKDDLKQLSNFGGSDSKQVMETVTAMGRHDLLYINPMGDAVPRIVNTHQ